MAVASSNFGIVQGNFLDLGPEHEQPSAVHPRQANPIYLRVFIDIRDI